MPQVSYRGGLNWNAGRNERLWEKSERREGHCRGRVARARASDTAAAAPFDPSIDSDRPRSRTSRRSRRSRLPPIPSSSPLPLSLSSPSSSSLSSSSSSSSSALSSSSTSSFSSSSSSSSSPSSASSSGALYAYPYRYRPNDRYRGSLLPSNVLLIGLALCCLTLSPVQPRQNHHQTCPGCPHQQQHQQRIHATEQHRADSERKETAAPTPDDLRLEAIKHQILTKLGLRSRPDVNRTLATVPRHLALETLYRAEAQSSSRYPAPDRPTGDRENLYSAEFFYGGDEYTYRNLDHRGDSSATGNGHGNGNGNGNDDPIAPSYRDYEEHEAQQPEEEMDDFYARTSEIITFAEPGRTLNGQPLLEFPMSSGEPALEPLRIKKATLWTRVEFKHAHHYQHHRQGTTNQRNITLWVFKVRCGNTTHLTGKELGQYLEMVTSLGVNVGQLGWLKFDITKVVNSWYTAGRDTARNKLTLLVDCTGCGSHVYVSTFDGHSPHVIESSLNAKGTQDPDRPFLVVRTDPAAVKRVRRRAIECSGAIKGQCCKQRFYVNFSQLGWDDWIIAPQGYYANYCRGDCAAGHRTPDTFLNYYTHVIEEYRKMDRLAGMQPCCAPLKFSPMSLIYYGPDSNIIKRDLPKMVVDECGCP